MDEEPQCKPPLLLTGAVGSGKTKLGRGIINLYGIPENVEKVDEAGEKDFWVGLDGGGLYIADNADTDIKWLPDALATASTGGGQTRRKL